MHYMQDKLYQKNQEDTPLSASRPTPLRRGFSCKLIKDNCHAGFN